MDKISSKGARIAVGIGIPTAAAVLLFVCLSLRKTPSCPFYELTGLYCPGCGTGRSFLALFSGDLLTAFRQQPLLICSLPLVVYYCAKMYIALVFGKDILPFPNIQNRWFGILVLTAIVAFWVLRNIPVYPFTLLAPIPIERL